ncbi:MAG: CYTH domain-containing protein [Oscillospiraceae bacterium]|jgi:inorganic triphosphatase YgiF|nr:CYTH domain-containing protein [Oscillospiraceae bacterium]
MGQEIEFKYRVAAGQMPRLEKALCPVDGWEAVNMETVYFDTADFALSARKWTLRTRLENDQSIVTLKTKAVGFARGEWELSATHPAKVLAQLVAMGAPEELLSLCQDGLFPICGAKFLRKRGTVSLAGGTTIELALDAGILTGGGSQEEVCELEVELKSGETASALAYAQELAAKWELSPEYRGKFTRALALRRK